MMNRTCETDYPAWGWWLSIGETELLHVSADPPETSAAERQQACAEAGAADAAEAAKGCW